jgi:hypothetical protein
MKMIYTASVMILVSMVASAATKPLSRGAIMHKILGAIEQVERDGTPERRGDDAMALADVVRDHASVASDPDVIRRLVVLLGDVNDAVRGGAAAALGFIGHKAASAIPALEKAYEERKDQSGPLVSSEAIKLALERIRKPSGRPKPQPPRLKQSRSKDR